MPFLKGTQMTNFYIIVYVDDIQIPANATDTESLYSELSKKYKLKI